MDSSTVTTYANVTKCELKHTAGAMGIMLRVPSQIIHMLPIPF